MAKIDVRGMSCPQPILMTKNAIKSNPQSIEVLVDDNTAKNNVSRFLKNSGYQLTIEDMDEEYLIRAKK
ncbi:sulfurtransferase TusA family protein [Paramaledivibacter caminithermalis]|uniref:TusA-related sulfurtransferase n=1 Tax=Paramaledivibacter caminithermalis (strain DSM 15212 / CIP 107654 / DViRD3) TaxID=1121301 RepID=A0A1M6MNF7_PARC5|nr:sulfurtransferase TusA family protein [Paramaledivibacter caminithermalis]SHJ85018.1 TusA-related sulfurtransferase [Paramaledivibacter caminithermalis DSM 15212]